MRFKDLRSSKAKEVKRISDISQEVRKVKRLCVYRGFKAKRFTQIHTGFE